MKLRERTRFYQQLSVLIRAGLLIRGSIQRLRERSPSPEIAILSEKVEAGERIGDAFAAAGFSPFECHLIVAGEKSGQLDTIFEHLGDFWKRELEMRQALIRPLYYPIVVLHLAVLMGALVQLATTPWPVVMVQFILQMAFLYVAGFVIYMLVRTSWTSPSMRRFWLFLPIIGSAIRSAYAYRWISALQMEFSAGVSITRAVSDAWRASGYLDCDRFADEGELAMRKGVSLSTLVTQWRQLPRDWIDFIETGEISGALDQAFKNLEKEAQRTWSLAQQRMAEWIPKIVYFFILLIVAVQVGRVMYQVEVAPLVEAEKQIDNATQ